MGPTRWVLSIFNVSFSFGISVSLLMRLITDAVISLLVEFWAETTDNHEWPVAVLLLVIYFIFQSISDSLRNRSLKLLELVLLVSEVFLFLLFTYSFVPDCRGPGVGSNCKFALHTQPPSPSIRHKRVLNFSWILALLRVIIYNLLCIFFLQ